jgi:hypothetical protein
MYTNIWGDPKAYMWFYHKTSAKKSVSKKLLKQFSFFQKEWT